MLKNISDFNHYVFPVFCHPERFRSSGIGSRGLKRDICILTYSQNFSTLKFDDSIFRDLCKSKSSQKGKNYSRYMLTDGISEIIYY